jgi:hypothetical protein
MKKIVFFILFMLPIMANANDAWNACCQLTGGCAPTATSCETRYTGGDGVEYQIRCVKVENDINCIRRRATYTDQILDAGADLQRQICQNPSRLDDCNRCGLRKSDCITRFNEINPLRQKCLALVNGPRFSTQQEINDANACLGYDFVGDHIKDLLRTKISIFQGTPNTGNSIVDRGIEFTNKICSKPVRLDDCDQCGIRKNACIARFNEISPCLALVNGPAFSTQQEVDDASACLGYDFLDDHIKESLIIKIRVAMPY